jgi:hypothetical protein
MELTGHKTEAVYRRYAIVSERDLSIGVEQLGHLTVGTKTGAKRRGARVNGSGIRPNMR